MIESVETGLINVFYRLGGNNQLPSLRECVDDILILTEHFLNLLEKEGGPKRELGIKARTFRAQLAWKCWQLQNVVKTRVNCARI